MTLHHGWGISFRIRRPGWMMRGALWLILLSSAPHLRAGTLTVTTLADSGAGSLRAQLAAAGGGDTIDFAPALTAGGPAIITLTSSNLAPNSNVTISGPGADRLSISGNGQNRVFFSTPAAAAALFISGLTITNGFAGNGGVQDAFGGGGVCSFAALTLSNCVVAGCSDPGGYTGGGVYAYGSDPLVLVNCTVANNTSASAGGGVAISDFNFNVSRVINCTIVNNTANVDAASYGSPIGGGGIFTRGFLEVTASTIASNSAPNSYGGGIFASSTAIGNLELENNIVAGNTAQTNQDVRCPGQIISIGGNVIGVSDGVFGYTGLDATGTLAAPLNPLLGPLQSNGGPLPTMALPAVSPAVDFGRNTNSYNFGTGQPLAYDERGPGFARIFNGTVDAGAFEFSATAEIPSLVVTTTNDIVNAYDNQTSLREALNYSEILGGTNLITFSGAATNGAVNFYDGSAHVLTLAQGELSVITSVVIQGPGADRLTVAGGGTSQVFYIAASADPNFIVTLNDLTVADGISDTGGGIENFGNLFLNNCVLTNNAATDGGGMINEGSAVLQNCTVAGNVAAGNGGGLCNDPGSTLSLYNCTLAGNIATNNTFTTNVLLLFTTTGHGSGIVNFGQLLLAQSSVISNYSTEYGYGVDNISAGTNIFANDLVAGNLAYFISPDPSNPTYPSDFSSYAQAGTNITRGGNCFGSDSGINPGWLQESDHVGSFGDPLNALIGPLQNNGGHVPTMALMVGGDAINNGLDVNAVDFNGAPLAFDQRGSGFPRRLAGRVDAGAYESPFITETPSLVVTTTNDLVSRFDFQTSLREAIAYAETLGGTNTITFSGAATNGAVNFYDGQPHAVLLTNGTLYVSSSIVIQGPGADIFAIDGAGSDRYGVIDTSFGVTQTPDVDTNQILGLYNLTITNGSGIHGGGLEVGCQFTMSNCVITACSSQEGGALRNFMGGNAVLVNCALYGNDADHNGGACYNDDGAALSLFNCTIFSNNVAGSNVFSSGALGNSGLMKLVNCSVVSNYSFGPMYAVSMYGDTATNFLANTIVAGNVGSGQPADINVDVGAWVSLGGNLIGVQAGSTPWQLASDQIGTAAVPIDPLVGTLQNNGGVIPTVALLAGSPAINAGVNASALDDTGNPLTTDGRGIGFARVKGGRVDVGAFESAAVPVTTKFLVAAPAKVTAGTSFNFTVTAVDNATNIITGYNGVLHFTSSDGGAVLPPNLALTNGSGVFSAILKAVGLRSLNATDSASNAITGGTNVTVVAGKATHFLVGAPANVTSGAAFNFTVTALDAFNNPAIGYGGTAHFTSSDALGVLPADSTLTSGAGMFSATLKTAGVRSLTATDIVSNSVTGTTNISVGSANAVRFLVAAPQTATAGAAFNFTVTAVDASTNTVTGYAGTVHFSSTDPNAILPANSTLTSGVGTLSATLKTAGVRSLTAVDAVSTSIMGGTNVIVVPGNATHFAVGAPANVVASAAFNFTVTALDAFNNTAIGYGGKAHFTSSDAQGVLPADSALVSGAGTFSATLKTAGVRSLTATDSVSNSVTGTTNVTVGASSVAHFVIAAPPSTTAGSAFNFAVTAVDASSNIVTGYGGTVHFSSSDASAVLPANSTLTSGVGVFSATLKTAGARSIVATDAVTNAITGSTNVAVVASNATHFAVGAPANVAAGSAFNFTVTALDAFNNPAAGYGGKAHFTSSDAQAVLPADSILVSGAGVFSATLKTTGLRSLTAADIVSNSVTGSTNVTVGSGVATHLAVTVPATMKARIPSSFTVTALDASGNVAAGYGGTVHFSSSDGVATLPGNAPLTNGIGTFMVIMQTAGMQNLTGTDVVSNSVTGTSAPFEVLDLQIVLPPVDQDVLLASNASFTVGVSGTAPFAYQWRANGTAIAGATGASLTVANVSLATPTNYTVVVSNAWGMVTSSVAHLVICGVFNYAGLQAHTAVLNPVTGLYEEKIGVTNAAGPVSGLQLLVGGLPSNVSLYNVAGTNNGLPYAQFDAVMLPGAANTFLLQFYNPTRRGFTNTVTVIALAAGTNGVPGSANNAASIPISKVLMDNSLPGSPRFSLGFTSLAGRHYQVLYSDDDLSTWQVADTLTAGSNWTIWTELLPPAPGERFFKVILLP
ncbi:MAG: choice-of-anchor Q domain-containing protein [Verrucomicrobiae bacterium]|nr:choice-of-anchor Q domain-containing protein [Verrucomicrobiae bacterium]